jgi:hypothetical protein
MDNHERLLKRIAGAKKRPTGEFVRTADGKVLFLRSNELRRATLTKAQRSKLRKLWSSHRRATRGFCRAVVKWLLRNDPSTQFWRETYVDWVNNC